MNQHLGPRVLVASLDPEWSDPDPVIGWLDFAGPSEVFTIESDPVGHIARAWASREGARSTVWNAVQYVDFALIIGRGDVVGVIEGVRWESIIQVQVDRGHYWPIRFMEPGSHLVRVIGSFGGRILAASIGPGGRRRTALWIDADCFHSHTTPGRAPYRLETIALDVAATPAGGRQYRARERFMPAFKPRRGW